MYGFLFEGSRHIEISLGLFGALLWKKKNWLHIWLFFIWSDWSWKIYRLFCYSPKTLFGSKKLLPSVKSPSVLKFSKALRPGINFKIAMLKMPSLLRAYLSTGGWVSNHVFIDYKLKTLHVLQAYRWVQYHMKRSVFWWANLDLLIFLN